MAELSAQANELSLGRLAQANEMSFGRAAQANELSLENANSSNSDHLTLREKEEVVRNFVQQVKGEKK